MRFCYKEKIICQDWVSLERAYRAHVRPDSTVLEVGASTVGRTGDLGRYCARVIGVELFEDRMPPDFDNVHYVQGDWQDLTAVIEPSSIDVVVASHVIEHVEDDLKAVDEMYAVLKYGGVGLINTPNRERLTRVIIELFAGQRQFPHWEHVREYTEKELQSLFEASRFTRYNVKPIAFGLCAPPVLAYLEEVPQRFRKYANFWEAQLFK